jgi:HSP20 family molecular chaperone IbpA
MNRSILFDSPFLLGFEHTRSLIERAAKAAAESYPPYNVEDRGDDGIRITLAVAGFIAARGFIRSFVLADGMAVDAATLGHGLLHIDLARPEPEKRVVTVPIRTVG